MASMRSRRMMKATPAMATAATNSLSPHTLTACGSADTAGGGGGGENKQHFQGTFIITIFLRKKVKTKG